MLAMPIVINQKTAVRQSHQLVTVSSRTHHSSFWEQETVIDGNGKTYSV
jgi:hypothetical protein